MSFCTECGFRLPDGAAFCPNCGNKLGTSAGQTAPEEAARTDNNVVTDREQASAETAYDPAPVQEAQHPDKRPGTDTYYGYPSSSGADAAAQARKNSSKAAIIVIASVAVLLITAAVLLMKVVGGNRYAGYWETDEIDIGYGYEDEIFGYDVEGMFGLQLNRDNTFVMISAFDYGSFTGEWRKTDRGLILVSDDNSLELGYERGCLIMEDGEFKYRFERSKRSIDNPSLKPGAYAGGGTPAPTETPVGGNTVVAGSGDVDNGEYYISIIGAENFSDIDGKSAIRIYYEFTNNSAHSMSAYSALGFTAYQDGSELEYAYSWDDADVYPNDGLNVRPGMTIQCCEQFEYNPKGGNVEAAITGWDSGESGGTVKATYVPEDLPGAPASYVFPVVKDPEWTLRLDDEGDLNDGKCHVAVKEAELIQDFYGKPAIRIYYEFTNNYGYETSMYESCYPYAYQDGISLQTTYDEMDSETDENYVRSIDSGETVTASIVFSLRNETSSVEAEVEEFATYFAIGQTYKIR